LALVPSASGNLPTMSICHNSIGAPRSQRFHLRERRSRTLGSIIPARSHPGSSASSSASHEPPSLVAQQLGQLVVHAGFYETPGDNAARCFVVA
jgi:hypothetical protein